MNLGTKVEAMKDISIIEEDFTTRMAVPKGSIGEIVEARVIPGGGVVLSAEFEVDGKTESVILFENQVFGRSISDELAEVPTLISDDNLE